MSKDKAVNRKRFLDLGEGSKEEHLKITVPSSILKLVAYLDLESSEPKLAIFPLLDYFKIIKLLATLEWGFLSHSYDECVVHVTKVNWCLDLKLDLIHFAIDHMLF